MMLMKQIKRVITLALLSAVGVVSQPAFAAKFSVPDLPQTAYQDPWLDARYDDDRDPIEGINRLIWRFNFNFLDQYLFRPTAVVYVHAVPDMMKDGINNFIENLNEPSSTVNNTLQGKFSDAGNSAGRFVINTSVGLLGTIDVAERMGMERKQDEFGEVLAFYGVGNGPYLMFPVLGPTAVREEVGDYVDNMYPPLSWLSFTQKLIKGLMSGLYKRAELMSQEKLLYDSLDPYAFVREAYFKHMEWKVHDGNVPEDFQQEEEFDDFIDGLDL
ncbi:MlaA family lipoprotein [Corallincola spongiicola]|nr:VacJ family lipoprotein [Corallincola spongiicola]